MKYNSLNLRSISLWTRSDKLNLISIVVGVCLGIIGGFLTWYIYLQQKAISEQQLVIKDFPKLLKNTKDQIDTISQINRLLLKQLQISQQTQNITNSNVNIIRKGNINKLYIAVQDLMSASSEFMANMTNTKDTRSREQKGISYVTNSKIILERELDNPFLLENLELSNQWRDCISAINAYLMHPDTFAYMFDGLQTSLFYVYSKSNIYCWGTIHPELLKVFNKKPGK